MAKTSKTAKPKARKSSKKPWPKVLYPLEPTSIPRERIDAAIDAVIARRKAAGRK
jgi:hypothetical protein